MKRAMHFPDRRRKGSTLVLSLIFIAMFSAMAAAMAAISGVNVQVAQNHRKLENTRACAESGLEVMRYWMSRIAFTGTTPADQRFSVLATKLQNELTTFGITNIVPVVGTSTITISNVPLNSGAGQSFSAVLSKNPSDNNVVRLDVTGHNGPFSRTIRSNYVYDVRPNTVFDFGIASRGPITLSGNIELEGMNIEVESNAYIESGNELLALEIIGNSHIAGNVKITNPLAYVHIQGGSGGIGGATGVEATQYPYTEVGAPPHEFPEMSPAGFIPYATNPLPVGADLTGDATFDNLIIPAGMNPRFSGSVTLRGVIYIETPNQVTFSSGVDITAIIVTNGDPTDNSGTNTLTFSANVNGHPVSQLPNEPQFTGIQDKLGTFIVAPGFKVNFGGGFSTLCGVIAANGVELSGNAGGTINGSIINYSDARMVLGGNSDLYFNRSGMDEIPAGFVPELVMRYDPSSYSEVLL